MKHVSTAGWKVKQRNVEVALAAQSAKSVAQSADFIFGKAMENLSGDHPSPLTTKGGVQYFPAPDGGAAIPVRVLTGTLRRSMKMRLESPVHWVVLSDNQVAEYNYWVHDGTKHMEPRPFLDGPVYQYGAMLMKRMGAEIKTSIRGVGR